MQFFLSDKWKDRLISLGRITTLLVLVVTIALVVTAFLRARKRRTGPPPMNATPVLSSRVVSIIEGYQFIRKDEEGREKLRLLAAKDISYDDGHHELEQVDLTVHGDPRSQAAQKPGAPPQTVRIIADRAVYTKEPGEATFNGHVKLTSSEGLEVLSEMLKYEQAAERATTDQPVQFKQGYLSGSSVTATLDAKARVLTLPKDARLRNANPDPKVQNEPPVDFSADRATYAELEGNARLEGNATITQGARSARASTITAAINPQTKKLVRVELRGNSYLKSQEPAKASELQGRDIDFVFDEAQRLTSAVATGGARAASLMPDAPRELTAERIEAVYRPTEQNSELQTITTQGRTTMKIETPDAPLGGQPAQPAGQPKPPAPAPTPSSLRVIEADAVNASFREDGKHLARAEATGNAVLTITPKPVTERSEKRTLRASRFTAEFFETGNALKTFVAQESAVADFEPMQPKSKLTKKRLSGKRIDATFHPQTQDVADLTVDGDAKLDDGDRHATAARAVYTASNQTVALRGKPQVWDTAARGAAEEIDANLETGESELRGRVRTTYYSRETTGGAAPFKNGKAPVLIAADRARARHNEGVARYTGNVRAWQEDDFVRADNLELDQGERMMTAWGNAQSAFYNFERENEAGRKETVPVFATSDRIVYTDANRTAHYEGAVKIKQGTDKIDAAVADVVMNEENKLERMTAARDVVLVQPNRRAIGEQVVYTATDDTAVLTGNPAEVSDGERQAVTKAEKLTLHFRDARIEANDANSAKGNKDGPKKRIRTTHRIQN